MMKTATKIAAMARYFMKMTSLTMVCTVLYNWGAGGKSRIPFGLLPAQPLDDGLCDQTGDYG